MDRIERLTAQFADQLATWGEAWLQADRANRLNVAFGVVLMVAGVIGTIIAWIA